MVQCGLNVIAKDVCNSLGPVSKLQADGQIRSLYNGLFIYFS
jgi:hypothetical protein